MVALIPHLEIDELEGDTAAYDDFELDHCDNLPQHAQVLMEQLRTTIDEEEARMYGVLLCRILSCLNIFTHASESPPLTSQLYKVFYNALSILSLSRIVICMFHLQRLLSRGSLRR